MLQPQLRTKLLLRVAAITATMALWSVFALPGGGTIARADARSLRICVDASGISVPLSGVRARLERVMRTNVEQHGNYQNAGFRPGAWTISEGCPMAPLLLTSGGRAIKNGGAPNLAGEVTRPSGFDVFVYVVAQKDIDRMFGTLPYQVAGQEILCTNDSCGEVSNAWYVSPETLARSDDAGQAAGGNGQNESVNPVAKGLLMAIGLEPVLPHTPRIGPQHK